MADETPDRVAATLARIRQRAEEMLSLYPQHAQVHAALRDIPRLLAAVEAALKETDRLDSGRGDYGHLVNRHEAAAAFRRAIAAALTGTQPSEDENHG